jgi:membrane protein YqaA with SNARE-associated domain
MFEWSAGTGLAALFAAAFVSATVLPANSEIVLAAVVRGYPDRLWTAIAVATVGNTLGGLTTYGLGRLLPQKRLPPERHLSWIRRHGAMALLLSWVPILGDALCAAAGWLKVPLARATLAIAVGKLARYVVVAYAATLL